MKRSLVVAPFFASGLLLAGCTQTAPPPPAASSAAAAKIPLSAMPKIESAAVMNHIKTLASDEFEGRAPGTPGEEKTVQYLEAEFKKLGLKPGNTDGTYIQKVPLVGITGTEAKPLTVTGKARGTFKWRDDVVAWTKHVADGASIENSDLVFAGYGVTAPEYNWDDFKGVDLKGQDDRRPRQRSPDSRSIGCSKARSPDLQRSGDDLLRPLDLQVRGGRAPRRRRRAHRPRNRPRRLSVLRCAGQSEREVRPRHAGQEHGPRQHRGLALERRRPASVQDGRTGSRRAQEAGDVTRLQAGASRAEGVDRREERDADDRIAQRARQDRGQRSAAEGRVRRLHGALGSLRHRSGGQRRQDLQRRARQRVRRRGDARDRARAHAGQASAAALDALHRRHGGGAGAARLDVLRA